MPKKSSKVPARKAGQKRRSSKPPKEVQALKKVVLTTDGACIGNPGPGGWACMLRFLHVVKELYGYEPHTTNNRMELTAVIEGLRALTQRCHVVLTTDSQYVKKGITEWLPTWKARDWTRIERTPEGPVVRSVLNKDLWQSLEKEAARHQISWEWVRGHAGHPDNIRCDYLANRAAREGLSSGPSTAVQQQIRF